MGLRIGELEGLMWENYRDGEMHISRSIWNGHIGKPKTRKSAAPVPVIRQLGERLELLRLRCQNLQSGPIFRNSLGNPLSIRDCPEAEMRDAQVSVVGAVSIGSFELSR
jgi:integrase